MGGYKGGQFASRMTVQKLADDIGKGISLKDSIFSIHHEILTTAQSDPEIRGMGSTVVAMKTDGCDYEIAWVGDSRAYLWNGLLLKQLTRDHSYIQYLIDKGEITEKDAINHPERNAITQALGMEECNDVEVDVVYGSFHKNEKILLCSDGLTSEVNDNQIASILRNEFSPQHAVDNLIKAAKNNGGADNITVILVSAPDDAKTVEVGEKTVIRIKTDDTIIGSSDKS
jgi:protein phosphatase